MAISNFNINKIQNAEKLYIVFNKATQLPYVECDQETYEDCIFVFESEDDAKKMIADYADKKYSFVPLVLQKHLIQNFLTTLYSYGVTSVVYKGENVDAVSIGVEQLSDKPDFSKAAKMGIPVYNPTLQLTCIYLMQEIRRAIPMDTRTRENLQMLHDLEEEMAVNLFKSKFIIPISVNQKTGKVIPNHPAFKTKSPNGDEFIAIFSDGLEFNKFNAKLKSPLKVKLIAVSYNDIKKYTRNIKGAVLNPAGFNAPLPNDLIDGLKKNYGGNS